MVCPGAEPPVLLTSFATHTELGYVLREQSSRDCVVQNQESIWYYRRIGDTAAEATTRDNLGHACRDNSSPPSSRQWPLRRPRSTGTP